MSAQRTRWTQARAASALATVIATVIASSSVAHAAEPEALALSLQSDEGSACLSAEGLASALSARVGAPVSTASSDAVLAVSVTVQTTAPRRFAIVIESHDRADDSRGRRELVIDDACEALTAPVSLVIALMIGTQPAEQASPQPAAPTAPTPTPRLTPVPVADSDPDPVPVPGSVLKPASTPSARLTPRAAAATSPADAGSRTATRFALGVGGGADLGLLPRSTPVVQLSGRVGWVPAPTADKGIPLLVELAIDLWPPLSFERGGVDVTVTGVTVGSALCSAWWYGDLSFEPCAGLWLRPLQGRAPDASVDAKWFLISGWSARGTLRLELAPPWSVFVGAQAVVPFGPSRLVLESSPSSSPSEAGDAPFFNAPLHPQPGPTRRLPLHELPTFGAVLVAGVTLAL